MKRWTPLALTYLTLAIAGLIVTWTYNIISIAAGRDYLGDWLGSGPSVLSLVGDVVVIMVCAAIFIVVEGRRAGMKWLWLYIVLMPSVAVAFAFPLFLAMRERALAQQKKLGSSAS